MVDPLEHGNKQLKRKMTAEDESLMQSALAALEGDYYAKYIIQLITPYGTKPMNNWHTGLVMLWVRSKTVPEVKAIFSFRKKTSLIEASENGDIDSVKGILKYGANVYCRDPFERYALLVAASEGHTEIVKLLVHDQADVNCRTTDSKTAVFLAALNGHQETVKFFIQNGLDRNQRKESLGNALHAAIYANHPEIVRVLLQAKCDVNYVMNIGLSNLDRMSPLIVACNRRSPAQSEIVDILLNYGCDVNYRDGVSHNHNVLYCLLHHFPFVTKTDNTVAKKLLKAGASVENDSPDTPLFAAILKENTEMASELLNHGANVNRLDLFGRSLLHLVTMQLKYEAYDVKGEKSDCHILKMILSFGADVRHVFLSTTSNLNNALDVALNVDYSHFVNWDCVVLLYLAGVTLSKCAQQNFTSHKDRIGQFILDDQEPLLALTGLCRRRIRAHLLKPIGGNHNNLIQAVRRLPLPRRLKQFLFFMENDWDVNQIPRAIARFIDSKI